MTEFMQKTENSYLWPSRFESNPQSYGSKGARNFADVAHCYKGTTYKLLGIYGFTPPEWAT